MRKGERRRNVFKKRKHVGVSKVRNCTSECDVSSSVIVHQDVSESRPSIPDTEPVEVTSASKKKLGDVDSKYKAFEDRSKMENNVNIIINLSILSQILQVSVKCVKCESVGLEISNTKNYGLCAELRLYCPQCQYENTFSSSPNVFRGKNMYDINTRLAYGLRSIGKGQRAAKVLCGVMNLAPPPSKFDRYVAVLGSAVEDVCFSSMDSAIEEAISINEDVRDIAIAIDGTWQKRGHVSLNGAITATSIDNGKVVDVAIFSKYCKCPDKKNHTPNCLANYSGSSGGMEVEGAKQIFQRSLSKNVRYTKYLGDGDSKGFSAVESLDLYDGTPITKLECLGHVQKRMGSRLRSLKSRTKGTKLSDGKTLGGKNRLTDAAIDQIQNYYGQAIRQNSDNLEKMKQAVWALYYHKISTDEEPHHGLCPKGEGSWCKYQKAIVTKEKYTHSHSIPVPIMETIKPVFQALSKPELLKKCLHGRTQNPNESLNNIIWNRIPKTVFVGIKTLHFGVYEAIASFNDGYIVKCRTLEKLDIEPGKNMIEAMKAADKMRIHLAQKQVQEVYKKARQVKRYKKRKLDEEQNPDDDPAYGPGLF